MWSINLGRREYVGLISITHQEDLNVFLEKESVGRFSGEIKLKTTYTVSPFCIRRNEKIACYITIRGDKAMQLLERGLKVEEYELLRCNFSDTGCLGFGIQEHIDLGIKYIIIHGLYMNDCKPSSKAKLWVSPTDIVGRVKLDGDALTIRGYIISGLDIVLLPGTRKPMLAFQIRKESK
ncbi:60S ribosomal protein L11, partial [Tanacetum coccineum]